MNRGLPPTRLDKAKAATCLRTRANQRAKANLVQALRFQTIAKFSLKGSSCVRDGRSEDALPRSSRVRDAWLDITSAGRRRATSCIRAMSALTDLQVRQPTMVSHSVPQPLKLCCGSAGLSDALRRVGFQVYPIDHSANRHAPKVKVFVLDVSNSEQVSLLESMLHHCKPCHVHMGLPCGTCSRAREKPMPSKLGGHFGPRPLRDADSLLGIPSLMGADKMKVESSNNLYKAAVRLLQVCMLIGCLVSIENPARSWLWPLLALLVKRTEDSTFISWFSGLESVYFDACAHGSSRDKRTKLLATAGLFTSLSVDCPGNHVHASWQPYKDEQGVVFPTAAEAEYPKLLCDRMAQCMLHMVSNWGVHPKVCPRLKDLLKMNMGSQTVRHPPLVPEYKMYVHTEKAVTDPAYKLLAAPSNPGADDTEQPEAHETARKRSRTTHTNTACGTALRNSCREPQQFIIPWIMTQLSTRRPRRRFKRSYKHARSSWQKSSCQPFSTSGSCLRNFNTKRTSSKQRCTLT